MTTDAPPPKPLPVPNEDTRVYWEACSRHELLLQRCDACGQVQFYPRALCSGCLSSDLSWQKATGGGTVYSYTVVHRPPTPAFANDVPYVVALIDLDEGVRMMSHVIDCPPEKVFVGQKVQVAFRDESPEISLPVFRPRE